MKVKKPNRSDVLKRIAAIILLLAIIIPCPYLPAEETENYCKDKESWKEWDALVQKYPNDSDIQTLHALRIGLCIKIERGSITFQQANDLFNRAHEMVIRKKRSEQKKKDLAL
jgi:hypothetical protein